MFLSSDLKHDPHAVRAFEACYIKHLKEQNEKVDHMICYSDGAASQFKAKLPFHYLSEAQSSLGVTQERSFFGTRHGKHLSMQALLCVIIVTYFMIIHPFLGGPNKKIRGEKPCLRSIYILPCLQETE